jgi:hypothetical protein
MRRRQKYLQMRKCGGCQGKKDRSSAKLKSTRL